MRDEIRERAEQKLEAARRDKDAAEAQRSELDHRIASLAEKIREFEEILGVPDGVAPERPTRHKATKVEQSNRVRAMVEFLRECADAMPVDRITAAVETKLGASIGERKVGDVLRRYTDTFAQSSTKGLWMLKNGSDHDAPTSEPPRKEEW